MNAVQTTAKRCLLENGCFRAVWVMCFMMLWLLNCSGEQLPEAGADEPVRADQLLSGIISPGWPDSVCDTLLQIHWIMGMQQSGMKITAEETNGQTNRLDGYWINNRLLLVELSNLSPGSAYRLCISGLETDSGVMVQPLKTNFSFLDPQDPEPLHPELQGSYPADNAMAIPINSTVWQFHFTAPVQALQAAWYCSNGKNTVTLNRITADRFSSSLLLETGTSLEPETWYTLLLYNLFAADGKSLPVSVIRFRTADGAVPVIRTDHPVISEICTAEFAGGGSKDEFIELYNPTSEPVDLAADGFRLYRAAASGSGYDLLCDFNDGSHFVDNKLPGRLTIPAYGFYLIANSAASPSLQLLADALITEDRMIVTDNATIALTQHGPPKTDKPAVDLLGIGNAAISEGTNCAPNPPAGKSLVRKAAADATADMMKADGLYGRCGNGWDSDNNRNDWLVLQSPEPQNSRSPLELHQP